MTSQDMERANGPAGEGPAQGSGAEERLAEVERELAEARAEAADLLDKYRRNAADFSNFRKRQEREREQQARLLSMNVMRRLLPLVDDLDLALAKAPADGDWASAEALSWVEGVRLVGRKLHALLESFGVRPIEATGHPFDPYYHEAVMRMESAAHPEGTVVADLRTGYLMDDEVLRPAQVAVAGKSAE